MEETPRRRHATRADCAGCDGLRGEGQNGVRYLLETVEGQLGIVVDENLHRLKSQQADSKPRNERSEGTVKSNRIDFKFEIRERGEGVGDTEYGG